MTTGCRDADNPTVAKISNIDTFVAREIRTDTSLRDSRYHKKIYFFRVRYRLKKQKQKKNEEIDAHIFP